MLRLHIAPAEGGAFERTVDQHELIIGRSTHCGVSLADRFLSRQHARLYRQGDEWLIEDLGSRNGTFVNGRRIEEPTALNPGDSVTMSASVIRVLPTAPGADMATGTTTSQVRLRAASDVLLEVHTPPGGERTAEGEVLHRYAERLALINEVHQALARPITVDELLELILDRAFQHLQPERAQVFLRDDDGGYSHAASRPPSRPSDPPLASESLVHEVAEKGMAALVVDTATDVRFARAHSLIDAGVRSLLAAPLVGSEGVLGFVVLSSNAAVRCFDEEDMELLVTLASAAALRIQNLRLAEEAAERRRMERELDLARRIQLTLLPESLPRVAGWELHGGSIPSRGVSGDYYQVAERAGGRELVLVVADVAGKGLGASLLTTYLEALSSTLIAEGLEPEDVFNRLGRLLERRTPSNRFVTAVLGVLEPATGRLRYANAGHVPGLVVRAGGTVDSLGATGLPLGLLADSSYSQASVDLEIGDLLVLYTDGYSEAAALGDEQFGDRRLADLFHAHRRLALAELAATLESEVAAFATGGGFDDDRTIVLVRRTA